MSQRGRDEGHWDRGEERAESAAESAAQSEAETRRDDNLELQEMPSRDTTLEEDFVSEETSFFENTLRSDTRRYRGFLDLPAACCSKWTTDKNYYTVSTGRESNNSSSTENLESAAGREIPLYSISVNHNSGRTEYPQHDQPGFYGRLRGAEVISPFLPFPPNTELGAIQRMVSSRTLSHNHGPSPLAQALRDEIYSHFQMTESDMRHTGRNDNNWLRQRDFNCHQLYADQQSSQSTGYDGDNEGFNSDGDFNTNSCQQQIQSVSSGSYTISDRQHLQSASSGSYTISDYQQRRSPSSGSILSAAAKQPATSAVVVSSSERGEDDIILANAENGSDLVPEVIMRSNVSRGIATMSLSTNEDSQMARTLRILYKSARITLCSGSFFFLIGLMLEVYLGVLSGTKLNYGTTGSGNTSINTTTATEKLAQLNNFDSVQKAIVLAANGYPMKKTGRIIAELENENLSNHIELANTSVPGTTDLANDLVPNTAVEAKNTEPRNAGYRALFENIDYPAVTTILVNCAMGSLFSGFYMRDTGILKLMMFTGLFCVSAILLEIIIAGGPAVLLGCAIVGLSIGLGLPPSLVWVAEYAAPDSRGIIFAFLPFASVIGMLVACYRPLVYICMWVASLHLAVHYAIFKNQEKNYPAVDSNGRRHSFRKLLKRRNFYKSLLTVCVLILVQQLSGVSLTLFLAPNFFVEHHCDIHMSLYNEMMVLAYIALNVTTIFFMCWNGRRRIIFYGSHIACLCAMIIAGIFSIHFSNWTKELACVPGIMLSVASLVGLSGGLLVPFWTCAEILLGRIRAQGTGIAVTTAMVELTILLYCSPVLITSTGQASSIILMASCNVVALCVAYVFLPEMNTVDVLLNMDNHSGGFFRRVTVQHHV